MEGYTYVVFRVWLGWIGVFVRPSRFDLWTRYRLQILPITFKFYIYVVDDKRRNPIDFWSPGQGHLCPPCEGMLRTPYVVIFITLLWSRIVRSSSYISNFQLLCNRWTEFDKTWREARSRRPLPSLCFGADRKPRWPSWPLIDWAILDFFSATTDLNSTKLDRKQDRKVLYEVFVFRADWKTKIAALASDWLRHFRLLCKRWMEFNKPWHEIPTLSTTLMFFGRSDNRFDRPGLWLAKTFWTLFYSHWMEFRKTWQEASFGPIIISMCSIPNWVT